jgi:hypothetical protein
MAAAGPSLDYRCLNLCMSDKNNSQACLAQCTYGQAPVAGGMGAAASPAGHNQFIAPVPVNGSLLYSTPPVRSAAATEDYRCLARCEQASEQVQLCREHCQTTTSPKAGTQILATSPSRTSAE